MSCKLYRDHLQVSGDRSAGRQAAPLPTKQFPLKPPYLTWKRKKKNMTAKKMPDREKLISTLRFLIDIHPIRPSRSVSLTFIYMGLHERYPGIVSYSELDTISRRKKTPEQIAEAILLIWRPQTPEMQPSH